MSQLTGRDPGMVGAALADDTSFIGLIADGFHVHDVAMKLAIGLAGPRRIMLISDAMPTAAGGPDTFELQGRTVRRKDGRLDAGRRDAGRFQPDDGRSGALLHWQAGKSVRRMRCAWHRLHRRHF